MKVYFIEKGLNYFFISVDFGNISKDVKEGVKHLDYLEKEGFVYLLGDTYLKVEKN